MSMTDGELEQSQATIVTLETEIAGLTRETEECIERARDFNARARDATGRRTSLQANLKRLRLAVNEEVNARNIEAKRKSNEEAAARSEAAKKDAEEAAAAKAPEPPMPSPMQILSEQVAILTAKIEELTAK